MMSPKDFKPRVHTHCLRLINTRLHDVREALRILKESAEGESKSSMGDKYETGRAMIHLEIEKQDAALHNLLQMQGALNNIDPMKQVSLIQPGVLTKTNHGWLYLATGLGKVTVDDVDVMVVSPVAPVVKALRQALESGEGEVNGRVYQLTVIS